MDGRANHASGGRSSGTIGFWGALALVMGNLIGSGIYLLPATLAPLGVNGTLGWIATIGGSLCLAFVFARLAAAAPGAGGPYAYADMAFGRRIGFAAAWSYWTLLWAGNGAIAVAAVSALSVAVPAFVPHAALVAVALVWAMVLVNIAGVGAAARVQMVTMLLKLLPLGAVILLAGWWLLGGAAVTRNPSVVVDARAVAGAAALTFWGFLGLESATVPADKVRDAARTVPRATLIGTAAVGFIYLAVSSAITYMMPRATTAVSPAPIADFLGVAFGGGVAQVVALFAAVSALGALNGFVLLQGEVPRAMAQGGVFPRWFGHESTRGVPVRAHMLAGVLVTVVTLANYSRGMGDLFAFVAAVSLAAGMLAYFVSALAAVRLLRTDPAARLAGVVSAGFIGWLSWGLGREANGWALALLLAGVPVYVAVRRGDASDR